MATPGVHRCQAVVERDGGASVDDAMQVLAASPA